VKARELATPPTISTETASISQRRFMVALSTVLVVVGLGALPYAQTRLSMLPSLFMPGYFSLVFLTDCLTAYLLLSQFSVLRRPALCILAGAYLFSGLMAASQFGAFPGIFGEQGLTGATPQTLPWLWSSRQICFPLFILAYAITQRYSREGEGLARRAWLWQIATLGSVLTLTLALSIILTRHVDAMPRLLDGMSYVAARNSGLAVIVWGLGALGLASLLFLTRCRVVCDLWLALAMLASLLEVTLTLAGGSRFSFGWYLARLFSLMSASVILAVFIDEITRLYMRVSDLNAKLQRLVSLDGLTGLANRRFFDERLAAEWSRALREQSPISLLMLDIDFFKKLNDRDGHLVGDECIKLVAGVIAAAANRGVDVVARYGGEEYAVILPATNRDGALLVAQRILGGVRDLKIPSGEDYRNVTVSIGMATALPNARVTALLALKAADDALYASKSGGRNRITEAPALGFDDPAIPVEATSNGAALSKTAPGFSL
jgi:diguanylate cyclase (GGDEF)-like protein